ncbi:MULTISPECIES: hypothetical protein [Providencia]|nr:MULTISPECIES: hypothetical protein [Providencia]EKT54728.1 hypothetical protein OOC_14309 [Providencia rettgeri Dmel1]ELR5295151.1 hypothetical protein [Providencia rettgeri]MBG5923503.1 hypothetical protein [Providencia rettgeri]MBS0916313.1 hypothetical protein [Providencia rettgeri]MCG5379578.1 hypothetical protein [Providencia rettgeri]
MGIKTLIYKLNNSSSKMLEVYKKNPSEANKKNLLSMVISKINNTYSQYGWDIESENKEKITKQINIINSFISINTEKSNTKELRSSPLIQIKSEHKLDRLAAYYDYSNKIITAEDMSKLLLNSTYDGTIHISSANIDFSGSNLSNTVVDTSNNMPLLRANFSDAIAENTQIKIPVKVDVDYNFTNANLKGAKITLDIDYDNLSDTVMNSLFGSDSTNYKSVFSSISTIDNKYLGIKQAAFKMLAKAYAGRKDYFEKNRVIKQYFLEQYRDINMVLEEKQYTGNHAV